jgi:hypothetical protein
MSPSKTQEAVEGGVDVTVGVKPTLWTVKALTASQFLLQSTTVATRIARVFFAHDEDVLSHPLCRLDQDVPKLSLAETPHVTRGLGSQPSVHSS